MSSLKPYTAYKDSGITWLGEVPVGWEVRRLGTTIQSARNGAWGDEPGEGSTLRCVRVADFDRTRLRIHNRDVTERSFTRSELDGRVLRKGDLLLEKSGGGEKSPVGFVVLYDRDEPALCSNFVAKVVLEDGMLPYFWVYVHSFMYRLRITERSIKQATGIQNLDQTSYFGEHIAVPSPTEQQAIADFLDRETAAIDAFVQTSEQLIELLNERRAAVITQAVTKGLDPTVPMKDSGIDWLGKVPEGWEVKSLRRVCQFITGSTPREVFPLAEDDDYIPWATPEDLGSATAPTRAVSLTSGLRPVGNSVLVCCIGTVGKVGYSRAPITSNQQITALAGLAVGRFWFYQMQAASEEVVSRAPGNTLPIINASRLGALPIVNPPLTVQKAIIAHLDRETAQIDEATAEARMAIELAKERRQALISAAVTGKIDVREAV